MRSAAYLSVLLGLAVGCDAAADATNKGKQAAADAVDKTKKLADGAVDASKKSVDTTVKAVDSATKAAGDAIDASKQAVDSTTKAATDALEATKAYADKTKKWWDDIPTTGELSEQSKTWLAEAAKDGEQTIEDLVAGGQQHGPAALRIAGSLASAVDSDSGFEPIYVKVGDQADADAKVGDMPKVEVVDGVKIGLKRMDAWEGLTQKKERGYLVLWREDDHLVGFVYRSRREIDMEKVAAEVPKLVALVRGATADEADGAESAEPTQD